MRNNEFAQSFPPAGEESILISKNPTPGGGIRTGEKIARKDGEVLIIAYDLGTTACESRSLACRSMRLGLGSLAQIQRDAPSLIDKAMDR